MNKKIDKHNRSEWNGDNSKELAQVYGRNIERGFKSVKRVRDEFGSWNLGFIISDMYRDFGYTNPYGTASDTYNYLYYANQLSYAWFQYVLNDGKPIRLAIADKEIETVGKFSREGISSGHLIQGIQAALIMRDQKALDFYAQIPVSFTEQADQDDIIGETLMFFYQMLCKQGDIVQQNEALATYALINQYLNWDEYKKYIYVEGFNSVEVWKKLFDIRKNGVEMLRLPLLEIYHAILHKNQKGYEEAVYQSLLKWKEYWTMKYFEDGEDWDHSTDPRGYWALPIIAACAYAYDRGMVLKTVESDYLCDWMIRGEFEGFELMVKD